MDDLTNKEHKEQNGEQEEGLGEGTQQRSKDQQLHDEEWRRVNQLRKKEAKLANARTLPMPFTEETQEETWRESQKKKNSVFENIQAKWRRKSKHLFELSHRVNKKKIGGAVSASPPTRPHTAELKRMLVPYQNERRVTERGVPAISHSSPLSPVGSKSVANFVKRTDPSKKEESPALISSRELYQPKESTRKVALHAYKLKKALRGHSACGERKIATERSDNYQPKKSGSILLSRPQTSHRIQETSRMSEKKMSVPLNIKSLQSPPPQFVQPHPVYFEAITSGQNGEWIEMETRPISMERTSAMSMEEPQFRLTMDSINPTSSLGAVSRLMAVNSKKDRGWQYSCDPRQMDTRQSRDTLNSMHDSARKQIATTQFEVNIKTSDQNLLTPPHHDLENMLKNENSQKVFINSFSPENRKKQKRNEGSSHYARKQFKGKRMVIWQKVMPFNGPQKHILSIQQESTSRDSRHLQQSSRVELKYTKEGGETERKEVSRQGSFLSIDAKRKILTARTKSKGGRMEQRANTTIASPKAPSNLRLVFVPVRKGQKKRGVSQNKKVQVE